MRNITPPGTYLNTFNASFPLTVYQINDRASALRLSQISSHGFTYEMSFFVFMIYKYFLIKVNTKS